MLVVDYYVLRKRQLNLHLLYDEEGPYKGVNWAAIIATVAGVVVALIFNKISWYASLIPAGLTYYILMKSMPSARRFLAN